MTTMPQPGRTPVTDPPPEAPDAVWRDVVWLDDEGRNTQDPEQVVAIVVDYRDEGGTPLFTARGWPLGDDTP